MPLPHLVLSATHAALQVQGCAMVHACTKGLRWCLTERASAASAAAMGPALAGPPGCTMQACLTTPTPPTLAGASGDVFAVTLTEGIATVYVSDDSA